MAWVVTILLSLLWGILGLLGLLLMLLLLPYRVNLAAQWDDADVDIRVWVGLPLRLLGVRAVVTFAEQRAAFYWMGLKLFSRSFRQLRQGGDKGQPRGATKTGSKKRNKTGDWYQVFHMARMPYKKAALRQLPRWFFLRATLQGRFGFDDPYTTGQMEGAMLLARTVVPSLGREVIFDYTEPVFEGRLNIAMLIWPPRIAVGMLGFLLGREGRAMLRHYRRRPKPARVIA